jgi:NADH-quinone oxidoreductase subunit L
MAIVAGFVNLPAAVAPDSIALRFEHFIEPRAGYFPALAHPEFSLPLALVSTFVALGGFAVAYAWFFKGLGFQGITERSRLARLGYRTLQNKYYLDWLYTDVIVGGIKGPIARAAYWFNQNVIDGVVNGAGSAAVGGGRWVYDKIDQGVIDGAVNASGAGAEGGGQVLRRIQTGRVQQYAALLFAGAALLAGVFIIVI